MTTSATATVVVPEWTVLYHSPGVFKGRGEFLRLMLEDAGVAYENSSTNLYGPQGWMDAFRGTPDAIDAKDNTDDSSTSPSYPVFFPPAIWHRPPSAPGGEGEEVLVNQVGACMMYLGEKLGYYPSSAAERARANQILLNALDYIGEGRASFHPVKNSMSYHDQKEQGDIKSKEWSEQRMLLFLHHFHKVVVRNGNPESPVAGGTNITYADFALFHVLDATHAQFNTEYYNHTWDKHVSPKLPALHQYYQWMKHRPKIVAYQASDRCAPFAGDSMM